MTEIWGDILHPESLRMFGNALSKRAREAKLLLTGIDEWDGACDDTGGGLDDYWYVVIGGASNVGKTQLLLSLAQRGLRQGFAVAMLTMEEPMDQIQRRIYASLSSELGYYDFTYDKWSHDMIGKLEASVPYLGKLAVNGELEDFDLASIVGYLDDVRDALFGRPLLVLVDHLQLVKGTGGQSIAAAATDVSEALRIWAKKNRTLTVAASQLTAEALREGRPPRSHDLWGGSAMYSNASQVFMLDHGAVRRDERNPHILRLWGLLDKNRYGPKMVCIRMEANLKTGVWRSAYPDEHGLWENNPWAKKENGRR